MIRPTHRNLHRPHGQSLVEFALVFPILFLVLMGVIDVGRLIYAANQVSDAAREGVRTAIVNQNASDIRTRAAQQATGLAVPTLAPSGCPSLGGQPTSAAGVCVAFDDPPSLGTNCGTIYVGCVAVVTVKASWTPITPIISSLMGPINVSSTSRQAVESLCTSASCRIP